MSLFLPRRLLAGPLLALVLGILVWSPGAGFAQDEPEVAAAVADSLAEMEVEEAEPTDLERAEEMMQTLEAVLDSAYVLQAKSVKAKDEELQLLRIQGSRLVEIVQETQPGLVKLISDLDPEDPGTTDIRDRLRSYLTAKWDIYEDSTRWWHREIDDLRGRRATVPPEELGQLETEIAAARARLDDLWAKLQKVLEEADAQEIDTRENYVLFDRYVVVRADDLLGRLQVADLARNDLREKIRTAEKAKAAEDEVSGLRAQLSYADTRVQGVASSLEATLKLMDKRGFPTASYRQSVIKTTGEISERVLDPKVVVGLMSDLLKTVGNWFRNNGPTILVKLLIIVVSVVVIRFLFRFLWWLLRLVRIINLTRLMVQLGNSLINPIATVVGLFIGFWLIGADPTTLLTGAGVAGVIIGFALQDSLSNLAAGFFILATRPFDIDDVIMTGGVVGTVKAMWIANTTVVTFDGRRLLIPNRKIWADVIENRSVEPNRRVDVTVRVGFDEDIDRAIAILHDLVAAEDRLLKTPEPSIFVAQWADSWVEIALRPWARNENWWAMLTDLPRQVALRFAEESIDIPFPRLDRSELPQPGPASGENGKT